MSRVPTSSDRSAYTWGKCLTSSFPPSFHRYIVPQYHSYSNTTHKTVSRCTAYSVIPGSCDTIQTRHSGPVGLAILVELELELGRNELHRRRRRSESCCSDSSCALGLSFHSSPPPPNSTTKPKQDKDVSLSHLPSPISHPPSPIPIPIPPPPSSPIPTPAVPSAPTHSHAPSTHPILSCFVLCALYLLIHPMAIYSPSHTHARTRSFSHPFQLMLLPKPSISWVS